MKKYGNTRIRDLIHMHPRVLDILKEFQFPCQTCPDQNCFVKDIPENENLSMEDEIKFMSKISGVVSGKETGKK